jgi:hypothetical protein
MSDISEKAEYQFEVGNFLSAKSAYEQELSETSDLRSRTDCEHKISECSKLYREVISSSGIGEAQFPLIHEKEEIASIVTFKVSSTPSGRKTIPINENIFKAVSSYLNSLIEKSSNRFCILDWRLRELELSIKPVSINHSTPSDIIGNSFELSVAMALLSHLIGKKIDPLYVFTGGLHEESGSVRLIPVVDYETKLRFAKTERPGLRCFFVPTGSGIDKEMNVLECGNFHQVVERVFPKLIDDLIVNLESWPVNSSPKFVRWKKQAATITASNEESLPGTSIVIFKVEHPADLKYSDLKRLFRFLKESIGKEIKDSNSAVLIDGIAPNFLTAVLLSSDHLKNPLNVKFISILKRSDDTVVIPDKYVNISRDTESVIVRFDNHKELEGEVFFFERE